MTRTLLCGARLFTGEAMLDSHAVLIEDGTILDIVPSGAARDAERVALPEDALLAPGLIDLQVNGGGGVLFNDTPTVEGALAIARAHRGLGTTGLLPTVITDRPEILRHAAEAAARAASLPGSGILGVHLEGPFLNPQRRGVHQERFIRLPGEADLEQLCALPGRFGANARVLLTLAPEQVSPEAIARLTHAGVRVSGGHSAASLGCAETAIASGLSGFTHLFNAMPPISSRSPGIALAAMRDTSTCCGVIVDGIHVHPALLRLALSVKQPGGVLLVSDSMPVAGTGLDGFTLQGRRILRRSATLQTEDGVLAGADLDMAQAVRNAVSLLGVTLAEALRMASLYPARFLGLGGRLGRLAPGYRADLVLFDAATRPLATWVGGAPDPASYRTAAMLKNRPRPGLTQ